ncbi:MAG: hypothetical protein WC821_04850 [archaeon]|jgi:hypothetical protein
MVIDFDDKEINFKKLAQIFISSFALAIALFLAIWVIDYLNKELNMVVLTNLSTFLTGNLLIVVGFVLFIGMWDYVYPFYLKWSKYAKPLVDALSLVFGLWLVVVFLGGLVIFNENPQLNLFLKFPSELFFSQLILIVLLFIFIKYSQFFLYESKSY